MSVHRTTTHIGGDILSWPEHWQRANGVTRDMLRLRGATHTIAQVLATPADTEVTATLVAKVVGLTGSTAVTHVLVDDGSARMSIACPYSVTLLGPALRRRYEFDVTLPPGPRLPPVDPESAAASITDPAAAIAAVLQARAGGKPIAIATAVRRSEP